MAVTRCPHAEGGNQLLRDTWCFAGLSPPVLGTLTCLWHVNLHVNSLSILCIHGLFTIHSASIHCHYFCGISSEELLTGKGCLSIRTGKKEKMTPSYSFQFKSISGPPDFIRPFKFMCRRHNHAYDLPTYVLALNSWHGSGICHPGSACGALCGPGV